MIFLLFPDDIFGVKNMQMKRWMCLSGLLLLSCQISLGQEPFAMDLTSSTPSLTPGRMADAAPIVINEGGTNKTVFPTSMLTPAERLAVYQVFSTNNQTIQLDPNGTAVGGSFVIGPNFSNYVSSLTIPNGVTAIKDFGQSNILNLVGNLTNSGTFYAASSVPNVQVATIAASNINNLATGLISSVLPTDGFFSSFQSVLSMNLVATNNIQNMGRIESSGNLLLAAGGSVVNSAQSSALASLLQNQTQPIMSALNNLSLFAATGIIRNEGSIISYRGSIDASTVSSLIDSLPHDFAKTLAIDNTNGSLSAILGDVNLSNPNGAISLYSGSVQSRSINFEALTEVLSSRANFNGGVININADAAFVDTTGANSVLGNVCLKGDPTFYNDTGDLVVSGNLVASEPIYLMAAGGIQLIGAKIDAPEIQMVSGVSLNTPGFAGHYVIDSNGNTIFVIDLPLDPSPLGNGNYKTQQSVTVSGASGLEGNITGFNSELKASILTVQAGNGVVDFTSTKMDVSSADIRAERAISLPALSTVYLTLLSPEINLRGDITAKNLNVLPLPDVTVNNYGKVTGDVSISATNLTLDGGGEFGSGNASADVLTITSQNISENGNVSLTGDQVNVSNLTSPASANLFLNANKLNVEAGGQLSTDNISANESFQNSGLLRVQSIGAPSVRNTGTIRFASSGSSGIYLTGSDGVFTNVGTVIFDAPSGYVNGASKIVNLGKIVNQSGNTALLTNTFVNSGSLENPNVAPIFGPITSSLSIVADGILLHDGSKMTNVSIQSQSPVSVEGKQQWQNVSLTAPSVTINAGASLTLKNSSGNSGGFMFNWPAAGLYTESFNNLGTLIADGSSAALAFGPGSNLHPTLQIAGDFSNTQNIDVSVNGFESVAFPSLMNVNSFFVQNPFGGKVYLPTTIKADTQILVAMSDLQLPTGASYSAKNGLIYIGLPGIPNNNITIPEDAELSALYLVKIEGGEVSVGGSITAARDVEIKGNNVHIGATTNITANGATTPLKISAVDLLEIGENSKLNSSADLEVRANSILINDGFKSISSKDTKLIADSILSVGSSASFKSGGSIFVFANDVVLGDDTSMSALGDTFLQSKDVLSLGAASTIAGNKIISLYSENSIVLFPNLALPGSGTLLVNGDYQGTVSSLRERNYFWDNGSVNGVTDGFLQVFGNADVIGSGQLLSSTVSGDSSIPSSVSSSTSSSDAQANSTNNFTAPTFPSDLAGLTGANSPAPLAPTDTIKRTISISEKEVEQLKAGWDTLKDGAQTAYEGVKDLASGEGGAKAFVDAVVGPTLLGMGAVQMSGGLKKETVETLEKAKAVKDAVDTIYEGGKAIADGGTGVKSITKLATGPVQLGIELGRYAGASQDSIDRANQGMNYANPISLPLAVGVAMFTQSQSRMQAAANCGAAIFGSPLNIGSILKGEDCQKAFVSPPPLTEGPAPTSTPASGPESGNRADSYNGPGSIKTEIRISDVLLPLSHQEEKDQVFRAVAFRTGDEISESSFCENNCLIAPTSSDITVKTPQGFLHVAKGACVCLVYNRLRDTAVIYNLHDERAGDVFFESASKERVEIRLGQQLFLTYKQGSFRELNPCLTIAYRRFKTVELHDVRAGISDFSIPSALTAINTLQRLRAGSNHERSLYSSLMKNGAALAYVTTKYGPYGLTVAPPRHN